MSLSDLIDNAHTLEDHRSPPEPWGSIVRFDTPDLPDFPTDIFPDWVRAFVEAEAAATQTPRDLSGMLALSVLATCAQRWLVVQARPGWVEPVNLYTVTALPPASRKSAVFRAFVAPLQAHEQQRAIDSRRQIADATARKEILEQRLDAAKREAAKAKQPVDIASAMEKVDDLTHELADLVIPKPPRLIVDDVTPEALATLIVEQNGRMAALSAEGDVFAIMAGRYSGGTGPNFGVFLKAHAGDTLRVDRRNRSEFVDWPALTLGITTQPDVVRGLAEKAGFRGQGLLGRFLYALPASMVGRRDVDTPPIPDAVRETYHQNMTALIHWREANSANSANSANENKSANSANDPLIMMIPSIYLLSISSLGTTLLRDFLAWLEPHLAQDGAFGAFADWAGKLAGAALRIAGLLHIAGQVGSHNSHNSQNEISEETLACAFRLAHYLIAHARAAFLEMGADESLSGARRALAWIEQRSLVTFTKRDLFEAIKGTVPKADDLDPVLKLLCDHGYIRTVDLPDRSGPGRKPSQRYEVHPHLTSGSHNSHNSQNGVPPFNFPLPDKKESDAPIEINYDAVRSLLAQGRESDVRKQCVDAGINPDLVLARANTLQERTNHAR